VCPLSYRYYTIFRHNHCVFDVRVHADADAGYVRIAWIESD